MEFGAGSNYVQDVQGSAREEAAAGTEDDVYGPCRVAEEAMLDGTFPPDENAARWMEGRILCLKRDEVDLDLVNNAATPLPSPLRPPVDLRPPEAMPAMPPPAKRPPVSMEVKAPPAKNPPVLSPVGPRLTTSKHRGTAKGLTPKAAGSTLMGISKSGVGGQSVPSEPGAGGAPPPEILGAPMASLMDDEVNLRCSVWWTEANFNAIQRLLDEECTWYFPRISQDSWDFLTRETERWLVRHHTMRWHTFDPMLARQRCPMAADQLEFFRVTIAFRMMENGRSELNRCIFIDPDWRAENLQGQWRGFSFFLCKP